LAFIASAGTITGVWGKAPSGVQGQSPWSGGEAGAFWNADKNFRLTVLCTVLLVCVFFLNYSDKKNQSI